jgi:hypothetical protein
MADLREPSHPPSEPQPPVLRSTPDALSASPLDANADRPVRIQLFVALLLGLVLVATGLYLWRRPRSVPEASGSSDVVPSSDASPATQALVGDAGIAAALAAQAEAGAGSGLSLADARIVGCHDKGSKKTPAEECDHLAPIEQALAHAIDGAASCVPATAGGGTIDYLVDVSFNRKKNPVKLSLPKGGRSMKNGKALAACKTAVTRGLHDVSVDGVTHNHARYEIAITATYPGAVKTPPK